MCGTIIAKNTTQIVVEPSPKFLLTSFESVLTEYGWSVKMAFVMRLSKSSPIWVSYGYLHMYMDAHGEFVAHVLP